MGLVPLVRATKLELVLARTSADHYLAAAKKPPGPEDSGVILCRDSVDLAVGDEDQSLHPLQIVMVLEDHAFRSDTGFAQKLQATTRRDGLFRTELPLLVSDPNFLCKASDTEKACRNALKVEHGLGLLARKE